MINTVRFAKRFNLRTIDNQIVKEENITLEQAATINEIKNKGSLKNGVAVIDLDDDISEHLDKINVVVFTNVQGASQELIDKATKFGKITFWTPLLKRETSASIDAYLLRKIQTAHRVHGTLLSVFGEGVLLTGKSGIGKSELALELVNRKHLFIGDDAIDVISFAGQPIGKAPRVSRDFLEVRGIGIVNLKGMFGIQSTMKEHNVSLILELVRLDDVSSSVERLGKDYQFTSIAGTEIPTLQVPVSVGRSLAPIIEAAVISFKQRTQEDYIAVDDLNKRLQESD